MEHLGARDAYPLDECLRLIKEEAHVFVGIYAHRYGYVPQGSRISITEAEYRAARTLPRFIYLVDEETPWRPTDIDRGKSYEKLVRFKQELRTTHIVKTFSSPHQLASFVAADLGRELLQKMLPATKRDARRKQVLEEAKRLAGALANRETYPAAAQGGRIDRFWQFYFGDLIGVENTQVEAAMVHLGELLNRWKADQKKKPPGLDACVLKLSRALASQIRDEA